MNNKIGVGILDLYDDFSLKNILNFIPEDIYLSVASHRKPSFDLPEKINYIKTDNISLASIKNLLIHDFRVKGLDYYFLIHSDQSLKDKEIFNRIIKRAETFGTWFLTGDMSGGLEIEDENNQILKISEKINTKFIFMYKGIVKNIGFFNERYLNGQDLDTIDYIIRLQEKGLTLPYGSFVTISENLIENKSHMTNPYIKDFPQEDKGLQHSYGYFMFNHKFIPGHNEPKKLSKEEIVNLLEKIQKNYAKK
jgi:hypothetical protein